MSKELFIVTGNKNKTVEFEEILKIPVGFIDISVDEVQSMDLEYVARKKTEEAYKIVKKPVITDDVGVFIEAWNWFPGPFAKFMLNTLGNQKILDLLKNEKNRSVIVRSVIGYHDGKKTHVFMGEINGSIAFEERGTQGWGFDPIIIPAGQIQTYAEMGSENKNKISHRRKAIDKLKFFLDSKEK